MNSFSLTSGQLLELRSAICNEKSKSIADKLRAVHSFATGQTISTIASVLIISEETVRNYIKRYQHGGLSGLTINKYQGSHCFLGDNQLAALNQHLEQQTYLDVEGIVHYVSEVFDVTYSISGMTQLLHRLGFVYKKAKALPSKADAEQQTIYLENLLKLLKEKDKNDPHYYVDGVHPQHNTLPSYGWVKRGKEAVVKSNTGRKRININGALNSDTLAVVMRSDTTINAQSTIELFKMLEAAHPEANTIYITLDNAMYYRSNLIKDYLNTSKIRLLFLPPYSPNLNLIERLWKYMKKVVLRNRYYEKFEDFKTAITHFFSEITHHKDKLTTLLTMNFHISKTG